MHRSWRHMAYWPDGSIEYANMQILFIGDIFGSPGRKIVRDHLGHVVETNKVDLVIANAENSAGGFGLTPAIADELFDLGCHVLTTGNHVWDKREIVDYFNSANGDPSGRARKVLRPANYAEGVPGVGVYEGATSEKIALGWYLDGRVTAVLGTQTHVPTADTRVLAGGTAYQTDVGMSGPYDSVIGVQKDMIVKRFLTAMPGRMEAAKRNVELHSVIIDVDETTGKARSIRRHAIQGD